MSGTSFMLLALTKIRLYLLDCLFESELNVVTFSKANHREFHLSLSHFILNCLLCFNFLLYLSLTLSLSLSLSHSLTHSSLPWQWKREREANSQCQTVKQNYCTVSYSIQFNQINHKNYKTNSLLHSQINTKGPWASLWFLEPS